VEGEGLEDDTCEEEGEEEEVGGIPEVAQQIVHVEDVYHSSQQQHVVQEHLVGTGLVFVRVSEEAGDDAGVVEQGHQVVESQHQDHVLDHAQVLSVVRKE